MSVWKIGRLCLAAVALVSGLTACGGGSSDCGTALGLLAGSCDKSSTTTTTPTDTTSTNTAPVALAGADVSVLMSQSVTLDGSSSYDAQGSTLTYSWTVEVAPAGSVATFDDASSATPTFQPDVVGTYVFGLTVNDGALNSARDLLTLRASVQNVAPTVNAGVDRTVIVGENVLLNGTGSTDANGDTLSFSWTLVSAPTGSTVASTFSGAVPTIVPNVAGTYVFSLRVSDGALSSDLDYVNISAVAANVNVAPVANPGADVSTTVGSPVILSGTGSTDANNDVLTYQWTLISAPTGSAAPTSSTAAVIAFTADLEGEYAYELIVSDGVYSSPSAFVRVQAVPASVNVAPVANAGTNVSTTLGAAVIFNGTQSHDDNSNDTLTYLWTRVSAPTGSAAAATYSVPVVSFVADKAGEYVYALVVSDGRLSSPSSFVRATVVNGNATPVANAGPAQSVIAGSLVILDGSNSLDANGDAMTYAWTMISSPSGSAVPTSFTGPVPTFTPDLPGSYTLSLVVNDGMAVSDPSYVVVTASTSNAAPVANAGTNRSAPSNVTTTTFTLDGSASSDANGDSLTYSWVLVSSPVGSTATFDDATLVAPSLTVNTNGQYVVGLTVSDGSLSSNLSTVVLRVGSVTPTANAGADQTITLGASVQLNGSSSSDPNGDVLTYNWQLVYQPPTSTVQLLIPNSSSPVIIPDVAGSYVFSLTVSDDNLVPNVSTPDSMVLTVN